VGAVLEAVVRPEGAEEGLLEGVVGSVTTEEMPEETQDLAASLRVEALEGWNRHGGHHRLKRAGGPSCEVSTSTDL
jgi:hypothetical protein